MKRFKYAITPERYQTAVKTRIENLKRTFPDRFWSGVDKSNPDGCWPWIRTIGWGGYGVMYRGKLIRTHRIAWELTNGPIPEGMCVLHKCDNRPCCNPSHLFIGTHLENISDMVSKNRHDCGRGPRKARAKITEDKVIGIIKKHKSGHFTITQISKEYGMCVRTVSRIIHGKIWSHVSQGPLR